MVEKIRFLIDENGEVHLGVEGVVGKGCEALSEPFETALGLAGKRTRKDSYYAEVESEIQLEHES